MYNFSCLHVGFPKFRVSIFRGTVQFLQEDFVDDICAITRKNSLEPNFIIIEILERVSIRNFDIVKKNIDRLHELGIQVALEDFGTGFSPLEYLSKLDLDTLKIDQLFTQTAPSDNANAVIMESIINLAQRLGIQAVAEGIETQEQLDLLKSVNCQIGQGYYINKPMSYEDFTRLLRQKICIPEALFV